MREIRFRAWVFKGFDYDVKPFMAEVGSIYFEVGQISTTEDDNLWEIGKECKLMQYTGLKDKNGKEIYEGDIVNMLIRENIGTYNVPDDVISNSGYTWYEDIYEGEVMYKDFGFCICDKKEVEFYLSPMEDTFLEVIGNIYENPELLK